MSVPRFIVAGVEPGPALDLVAGALLAGLGEHRTVRPVLIGLDLPSGDFSTRLPPRPRGWSTPLSTAMPSPRSCTTTGPRRSTRCCSWRLALYSIVGRASRARAPSTSPSASSPLVLVLDARDRGATAAAAVCGVQALAKHAEVAGLVVVGRDDSAAGRELMESLRRDVALPLRGHIPPQLSADRAPACGGHQRCAHPGPQAGPGHEQRLCEEAATYLRLDELEAIAAQRGYLPSVRRRCSRRNPPPPV